MGAPIPPMLKYSVAYNLLNFPLILIKFVSKFIVCKALYFKAQYLLRLHSPLKVLIVLGFIDTSTLVGHFVSSPTEREKKDRRDSRGDEREGQGKKEEQE